MPADPAALGESDAAAEAGRIREDFLLAVAATDGERQAVGQRIVDLAKQRVDLGTRERLLTVDQEAVGQAEDTFRPDVGLVVDKALVIRVVEADVPLQPAVVRVLQPEFLGHALPGNGAVLAEVVDAATVDIAPQEEVGLHVAGNARETQVRDIPVHAGNGIFEIGAHGLREVEVDPALVLREEADAVGGSLRSVKNVAEARQHARRNSLTHADILIGDAVGEGQRQLLGGRPADRRAHVVVVGVVAASHRVDVPDIAVGTEILEVDARGKLVLGQWNVQRAFHVERIETPVVGHQVAFPLLRVGRVGGHADAAAQGVGTEIGGLRSTQHLDTLDVHDRRVDAAAGEIEIVHVEPEGRGPPRLVGVHEVGDAAHADLAARARTVTDKGRVGRPGDKIRHVAEHVLLDRGLTEGGDGDGHLLQALFPALGGDHDFLEGTALRESRARAQRCAQHRHGQHRTRSQAEYCRVATCRVVEFRVPHVPTPCTF